MGILQIFTLLGALGMFLYGMNLMSSGLQKAAGEGFAVSGQNTPDSTAALYGLSSCEPHRSYPCSCRYGTS